MNDDISRQAAIDALEKEKPTPFVDKDGNIDPFGAGQQNQWYRDGIAIMSLPSAQTEWNNYTVARLLAELFGDTCACNYNGIGEWLPEKCELLDSCPNPVGVACWEQFLKHKAEEGEEA